MTTNSPAALITGGGSGIGAATARQLLDRGYRVTIVGRQPDRLERFAAELGKPDGLLALAGDASDYDLVRSAVQSTVDQFGRLDAAVANAGFATHDTLADGDPAGWRDMVLTNVLGPALLIRAALPALKRTRGRIVPSTSATLINTAAAELCPSASREAAIPAPGHDQGNRRVTITTFTFP
jgi:NAD(P)-dependent dehydrogenase (short-subunit alcohol dehydrogenase family)